MANESPRNGVVCPSTYDCCLPFSQCCDPAICNFCTAGGCDDFTQSVNNGQNCIYNGIARDCVCKSGCACISGFCQGSCI